jgi:hypothetical protein
MAIQMAMGDPPRDWPRGVTWFATTEFANIGSNDWQAQADYFDKYLGSSASCPPFCPML